MQRIQILYCANVSVSVMSFFNLGAFSGLAHLVQNLQEEKDAAFTSRR